MLFRTKKHTPVPWRQEWSKKSPSLNVFGANGYPVCRVPVHLSVGDDDEANAEFIIQACNAYDNLLEACKDMLSVLTEPGVMDIDEWKTWKKRAEDKARVAIQEGKKET